MKSAFAGFVDERLEASLAMLREQNPEFAAKEKRCRELRMQLDTLSMSEEDMAILQEYLQVEFEIRAAVEPAAYRTGMGDGIALLRVLGLG